MDEKILSNSTGSTRRKTFLSIVSARHISLTFGPVGRSKKSLNRRRIRGKSCLHRCKPAKVETHSSVVTYPERLTLCPRGTLTSGEAFPRTGAASMLSCSLGQPSGSLNMFFCRSVEVIDISSSKQGRQKLHELPLPRRVPVAATNRDSRWFRLWSGLCPNSIWVGGLVAGRKQHDNVPG